MEIAETTGYPHGKANLNIYLTPYWKKLTQNGQNINVKVIDQNVNLSP